MKFLPAPAPALLVVLAVLVCALPWGGTGDLRLVMPLLPYVVFHRCVERWGDEMPEWLAFVAGFAMDVVGQGPLGYWPFIYLCGYTMVRSATADGSLSALRCIIVFCLTIASLALMQWSVASIYFLRPAEITPLVVAAAIATTAYVLLMTVLPSARSAPVRANIRLERGL